MRVDPSAVAGPDATVEYGLVSVVGCLRQVLVKFRVYVVGEGLLRVVLWILLHVGPRWGGERGREEVFDALVCLVQLSCGVGVLSV